MTGFVHPLPLWARRQAQSARDEGYAYNAAP